MADEVLRGRYIGDVCAPSTYQKGVVKNYPEILKACYDLGRNAAEELQKK